MNLRDQAMEEIEAENEMLRAKVQLLEQELTGGFVAPIEWRLTVQESKVMGVLLSRELATKSSIMTALYVDRHDGEVSEAKIVDVFICKIRSKLAPWNIEIKTRWGQGYFIPAAQRRELAEKYQPKRRAVA